MRKGGARRWAGRCGLLLWLGPLLGGCPAPVASPATPTASPHPRPTCSEAWAGLPATQRSYDFGRDSRVEGRGNLGYADYAQRLERPTCEKEWTVLIYMMADYPGLPRSALWNLQQMESAFAEPERSAASAREADVVVQLDVPTPPGIRRLQLFRSDERFEPLRAGDGLSERAAASLRSPIVEWLDEADEATRSEGESLRRFLAWGMRRYPARHYLAIVWGHGFGWRPRAPGKASGPTVPSDELHGGLAPDATDHKLLDIPSLHDALAAAERESSDGRPIDIYLSDACLMQSVEVARELADVARYVGGAEAKLDPLGLPYRLLLPYLNGGQPLPPSPSCLPLDAACQLANLLPELIQRGYSEGSGLFAVGEEATTARVNLTYSTLESGAVVERLQPALHGLGTSLEAYLREEPFAVERQQDLLDILQPHPPSPLRPSTVYPFPGGSRDLGSLVARLRAEVASRRRSEGSGPSPTRQNLLTALDEISTALQQAVVAKALGSRYDDPKYAGMAGLSVWLPVSASDYQANIERYASAKSYQPSLLASPETSPWRRWLETLFSRPAASPVAPATTPTPN